MIEGPRISPYSLRRDHNTREAQEFLEDYETARARGSLTLIKACSDSRLVFPKLVAELRSIAGGGPRSPYNEALNDPHFPVIIVMNHHDGDTVKAGQIPGGCGGREGKAKLVDGFEKGVLKFLKKHVWDADLYKQSVVGASFTSDRASGKPTLAATMDHLDLSVDPMGYV